MQKEYKTPTARIKEYVSSYCITVSAVVDNPDLDNQDNWIKNPDPV